ncbi:type I-C CRISPR-associated protein Cas8c/Csd1 [Lysinibacillus piscis]|uniref:Type I-C CRISPR-associated protein Cas8c/Csd1 n=1 Tax=Lysinibacillus piscis TaxID=2518931 RepID=A0ABQ5NKL5_9BACI|nr:type I-C CRISPR-associated protein Cas8c/Csd1 [Lysinibacillus sp. KH24]GLC88901.1 type I-C CRISPR-associated protein Cas8c/Csd1 [Lysinibacillus sp. KH24]
MNYLQALYETYENSINEVGKVVEKPTKDGKMVEYMLLPISHTTQTAHIEVTVNLAGEFLQARVIDKVNTILPFTEESGSRAGKKFAPHVLHDKLMYVAGDYCQYTGEDDKTEAFHKYIEQLGDWCTSPYTHSHVEAIYSYVKQGTVIKDLVQAGVLHVDGQNRLLKQWKNTEQERPKIFSILTGEQASAFIRFTIHEPEQILPAIWRNEEIFNAYIDYYNTKLKEKDICYVSGERSPMIERHPNKLRNSGDKAKLISANDSTGYTYRGRFKDSLQAANISYDVSQKAHNALKWLIERQGKQIDGRVFLVWGSTYIDMFSATEDLFEQEIDFEAFMQETAIEDDEHVETREMMAKKYSGLLVGVQKKMSFEQLANEKVFVLTLDAATPGRMAVLYYRDFQIQTYFDRLRRWHRETSWRQVRKKGDEWKEFYGSPSFYTIAHAAFGPRPNDKVVKGVMERLLPCVLDGRNVPLDITRSAIIRASNPQFYDQKWEWEQVLTVACALVRKHFIKEGWHVALNTETTNRDYLFGRLLAVADVLERSALGAEENRATNALRYMNMFQSNPQRTWSTIQRNLQPYQMKLREKGIRYSKLIDEIASKFELEDFNNKPLSGKYLLGYYSQRQDLYTKKEHKEGAE